MATNPKASILYILVGDMHGGEESCFRALIYTRKIHILYDSYIADMKVTV